LETRALIATACELKAQYAASAAQYIAENTELCARSRDAIARSTALIVQHRDRQ